MGGKKGGVEESDIESLKEYDYEKSPERNKLSKFWLNPVESKKIMARFRRGEI